ncbi:adenylyltransferase/cytidyltransferase family protein [Eisenibacter elegans]|uniref:adenylyltransferase/cytidyltransferase family protein n=1 Tax=Eisenibacter elegans TaxID=997 RepID=UPI00040C9EC8|nr:adenylyltransferase/cytidyltransferase family protein [Eisenibacter elegans]
MILYQSHQAVFESFGLFDYQPLAARWQEAHRYYHNEAHLQQLLERIEGARLTQQLSDDAYASLIMAAYFHDAVYEPRRQDNEVLSALLFEQMTAPHPLREDIKTIILDTATHQSSNELSAQFSAWDMEIVSQGSLDELLAWERGIFKEYQFLEYSLYKQLRLQLLARWEQEFPANAANLQFLQAYLRQYRPRIGVYAGSFNPFHNGHLNILEKAEAIFDKIIVAQGINPEKQAENLYKLTDINALRHRQLDTFSAFLTEYLSSKEQDAEVVLVRGLRNGDDLDYEVNQLRFMDEMKADLKIVFIPCDKQFEHISSSGIKNLEKVRKGAGKQYLPL